MKFSWRSLLPALVLVPLLTACVFADEGPLDKSEPKGITPEEIIKRFAAKEKEFKEARDQYTYRQDVTVQTVDGDTVDGEYKQVFDITFDDQGHKLKNVVFAPQATLTRIGMSQEDIDDIENRLPFVLTSDEIPEYNALYVGMQQEDELHCYVFDIAPKEIVGKKRYFQGRIWVDDVDFQVVKTYGKTVPDIRKKKGNENLFPSFTTWRQRIDGKYWFPVYTKADDTLHFSGGLGDVHIREIVKYKNYKKFGSKTRITYEGKELPPGEKKDQTPQQQPQK
jgi:outer membrane lipoprotein-sorting protein